MMVGTSSKKNTLPETNIAGWKIHHFDGIYQERWDFHGRAVSFREGTPKKIVMNFTSERKETAKITNPKEFKKPKCHALVGPNPPPRAPLPHQ